MSSGDPTNICYMTDFFKPSRTSRKKAMTYRRFAHCSAALNGYVYVIGGFDNKDADGVASNTLDSCEKFSIHENKWTNINSVN